MWNLPYLMLQLKVLKDAGMGKVCILQLTMMDLHLGNLNPLDPQPVCSNRRAHFGLL